MRPETMAGHSCNALARKGNQSKATAGWSASLLTAVAWLEQHLERRRSRRALLRMSEAQLKDIGLSRSTAYSEATRSFWQ